MSTPDLTNVDIDAILADVQNVLVNIAKSEKDRAEKLAKAVGDDEKSKMDADDAGEASSAPAPAADDGGPPEQNGEGADGSGSPADDPAAPGDEGGEGQEAGGAMDPAALQSEYAKLPLDELKMHAEAAQAALASAMGGGMGAGGPPAGPGGPEASAPAMPPPAMKNEMNAYGNGGQKAMAKSEAEVASLRKSLEEQGKMLERVIGAFEAVVSKPMRKAETMLNPSAAAMAPKLSKAEVGAKLRTKVRDTSLTKNDRELINDFFLGNPVDVSKLSHLLK